MNTELVLYTTEEASKLLKLSTNTLAKWRMGGHGPRYMKCGNRIRYPEHEIRAFISEQTIDHTGQTGV